MFLKAFLWLVARFGNEHGRKLGMLAPNRESQQIRPFNVRAATGQEVFISVRREG
jgi:hypothetical protein